MDPPFFDPNRPTPSANTEWIANLEGRVLPIIYAWCRPSLELVEVVSSFFVVFTRGLVGFAGSCHGCMLSIVVFRQRLALALNSAWLHEEVRCPTRVFVFSAGI